MKCSASTELISFREYFSFTTNYSPHIQVLFRIGLNITHHIILLPISTSSFPVQPLNGSEMGAKAGNPFGHQSHGGVRACQIQGGEILSLNVVNNSLILKIINRVREFYTTNQFQMQTRGSGSKHPKNLRTSYLEDLLLKHQLSQS